MAHVLVVGGTGMLQNVSLFLAENDNVVSVVARTPQGFERLMEQAESLPGKINPVQVNYENTDQLRQKLRGAVEENGPFSLAVNWIHPKAPQAPKVIAEFLEDTSYVCRYFHVMGNSHYDPQKMYPQLVDSYGNLEKVLYRKVYLGYMVENGFSRWLTRDEISKGIIAALRDDARERAIGNLEPWESRPRSA